MTAFLTDHLWQSLLCLAAAILFAATLLDASAQVRLWLWRIAAVKFLVPFAIFQVAGGWWGFPVMHASEPAPAALVDLIGSLKPWLAPVENHALRGAPALGLMLLLLGLSAAWLVWILRQVRVESALAKWEAQHELDESALHTRPVGFVRAGIVTLFVIIVMSAPAVTGAVDDRQHRHGLLQVNARALRDASYDIRVSASGKGGRSQLHADDHGVLIRNVSVQQLIALAFGVPPSAVMGDQWVSRENGDPYDYWLIWPRYDVTIKGTVLEPEIFESYALHGLITRLMAEKFGIEIHLNGRCQAPCGKWALPTPPSAGS